MYWLKDHTKVLRECLIHESQTQKLNCISNAASLSLSSLQRPK